MHERTLTEVEVLNALHLVFSPDMRVDTIFLHSLQPGDVKKAYRVKALHTHPDRFAQQGEELQRVQAERFISLSQAYETLNHFLSVREHSGLFKHKVSAGARPATARRPQAPFRQYAAPFARPFHGQSPRWTGYFREQEVPQRHLRFAEFLYYARVIPREYVAKALLWQQCQRPRIGEIAQKWRWVTEAEVKELLRGRRPGERLGDILLRQGFVSPFWLRVLLRHQQRITLPIGRYFVQEKIMAEWEIRRYLLHQERHNVRFAPFTAADFKWK